MRRMRSEEGGEGFGAGRGPKGRGRRGVSAGERMQGVYNPPTIINKNRV